MRPDGSSSTPRTRPRVLDPRDGPVAAVPVGPVDEPPLAADEPLRCNRLSASRCGVAAPRRACIDTRGRRVVPELEPARSCDGPSGWRPRERLHALTTPEGFCAATRVPPRRRIDVRARPPCRLGEHPARRVVLEPHSASAVVARSSRPIASYPNASGARHGPASPPGRARRAGTTCSPAPFTCAASRPTGSRRSAARGRRGRARRRAGRRRRAVAPDEAGGVRDGDEAELGVVAEDAARPVGIGDGRRQVEPRVLDGRARPSGSV